MKSVLTIFVLGLCVLQRVQAKTYTRCGLAQELNKHAIFKSKLPDWVCLVENESGRNSNRVGAVNSNGSRDYGLFQINDKYWCGKTAPGGDCNLKCQSLIEGDGISNAAKCVEKIYRRHGFDAWYGWKNKCKGKKLPNLKAECKI